MLTNLPRLYPNLFRALEIAKLGKHSVSIMFQPEYKEGFDDYIQIKQFCNGWFDNFISNGDITIEIVKPNSYSSKIPSESLDDIKTRIVQAVHNTKPTAVLDNASETLLKTAMKRLNISSIQHQNIINIAKTIAQLEGEPSILPQHIAESMQYNHIFQYDTTYLTAEIPTINFGNMITIQHGNITNEMASQAIEYLSKFTSEN